MKDISRSIRRHHSERYFNKTYNRLLRDERESGFRVDLIKHALKLQNNPKTCSCDPCRNVRNNRWRSGKNKLSLNEIRNLDADIERF